LRALRVAGICLSSGLPVVRYSPEALQVELGKEFRLLDTRRELHLTPAKKKQAFVYCLFEKGLAPA
jgi:hypothetical protein